MTVIHLLRHGEHDLQGKMLVGRMPGVGISPRGRADIAAVAERLSGDGVTAIYASPLQRTRESAEIIGTRLGLPVALRDDLLELDFGEWTGSTFDAIRGDPRWQAWANHRSLACIPGGETMRHVQRRVVEALMEMSQLHLQDTVVAVSHGDVIRAALCFALGMPLDLLTRIEVVPASLTTIRIDSGGIRVLTMGERPRPA